MSMFTLGLVAGGLIGFVLELVFLAKHAHAIGYYGLREWWHHLRTGEPLRMNW